MNKQELIEAIKAIKLAKTGDEESDHIEADNLLLEFINDKEISEAFNAIDKWYA